ncbi:MAG: entericidin A/B family lipoprotein [Candidatus Binatia bacterium]
MGVKTKCKQEIHYALDYLATLMLVLLGTNLACNTIHGFGRDVERAGEKTQDAADAVKKKL